MYTAQNTKKRSTLLENPEVVMVRSAAGRSVLDWVAFCVAGLSWVDVDLNPDEPA